MFQQRTCRANESTLISLFVALGCPRPHRRLCGGRRGASPEMGEPRDAGRARGGEEHQIAAIRRLKSKRASERGTLSFIICKTIALK